MTTMGAQLPELFAAARGVNSPVEGLARALADRMDATPGVDLSGKISL